MNTSLPVLLLIIVFNVFTVSQNKGDEQNLTSYVNPFIGTSGGGNTFPGAVVPWGMVSVSPHNTQGAPSGYIYGQEKFYGLGMVHLSGTGCADLGSIIINVAQSKDIRHPDTHFNKYSTEIAMPGYYSVKLDDHEFLIEASATIRAGIIKFTASDSGASTISINAGRSLGIVGGGSITIVSDTQIEGFNISGGFCGEENREEVFFSALFSKPFNQHKLWINDSLLSLNSIHEKDMPVGALLDFNFDETESVILKIGISYVSVENARLNLLSEIPGWDFDSVRSAATSSWNNNLCRIITEGGNDDDRVKFYTAMYHSMIHPNIINDINGEYPLMGRMGTGKSIGRNRYSVLSLWDTYRTLHPFYNIVFPEIQSEIIKTMIEMYEESGFLPKWELKGTETYMMVGDPAAIVIADSYVKGIRNFDAETALNAMLKPALLKPEQKAPPIRAGYHELLKFGYIPFEQNWDQDWWVWGPVSTTLEYCLSDFAISRMASLLNREDISYEFYQRSLLYRNLFDTVTQFIRPKLKNGNWMEPFDELAIEGSGYWEGAGGPGYVEGNAWNYTWFVPHDISGLIRLFGGSKNFTNKLYESFINNQFTINNEPDIAYPYLFRYVIGAEEKTELLIKKIMNENFGIEPDGLPGNDDCGTISAWFIFSAMGFYPDCPSCDYYILGFPLFDKIIISLNSDYFTAGSFIIEKENSRKNRENFINNRIIQDYKLPHKELDGGGRLTFRGR